MLSVNRYDPAYLQACRDRFQAKLAAFDVIRAKAPAAAVGVFEPLFCNDQVLVLDHLFMHRARAVEGKDGNPANEVRVLVTSLLENGGALVADKQIKLKPDASILGLAVGDEIRMNAADLRRLADAYFAEIEARFT